MTTHKTCSLSLLLVFILSAVAAAQKGELPVTVRALKLTAKVNGVFAATKQLEVKSGTKNVGSLTIERIVPHGAHVKKGEPIIWFKVDDVEKKLQEAEYNFELASLGLQETELSLKHSLAVAPLDKALAERQIKQALEDYDLFLRTAHPRSIESTKFSLKLSHASLENALEELKQLEKMYKEDELTEESEEIVLKRARLSVESARFRLEGAKLAADETLKLTIPREAVARKAGVTRAELEHAKSKQAKEYALAKQKIELTKARFELEKQAKELSELRADRKSLVIHAKVDGIVYHGQLVRGKFANKQQGVHKTGTSVTNKQVIVTIVDPNHVEIMADVEQKDLAQIAAGKSGYVTSSAAPQQRLAAKVKSISRVPLASGKHECTLTTANPKGLGIVPGMTCSVTINTYSNPKAIMIPAKHVQYDTDNKAYVDVVTKDGPQRRNVKVGMTDGDDVEITAGLQASSKLSVKK